MNEFQTKLLQVIANISLDNYVSGAEIAEELGIDALRVRDHLEVLRDVGYLKLIVTFGSFDAILTSKGRLALDDSYNLIQPPATQIIYEINIIEGDVGPGTAIGHGASVQASKIAGGDIDESRSEAKGQLDEVSFPAVPPPKRVPAHYPDVKPAGTPSLYEDAMFKVASDIQRHFTRKNFETFLLRLGLYSFEYLSSDPEYRGQQTKLDAILFLLRGREAPIVKELHQKGYLSEETLHTLAQAGLFEE